MVFLLNSYFINETNSLDVIQALKIFSNHIFFIHIDLIEQLNCHEYLINVRKHNYVYGVPKNNRLSPQKYSISVSDLIFYTGKQGSLSIRYSDFLLFFLFRQSFKHNILYLFSLISYIMFINVPARLSHTWCVHLFV